MQLADPASAFSTLRFKSRSSSNGPLPSSSDPHVTSVQTDTQDDGDGGDVAMNVSVETTYSNKGTASTANSNHDGINTSATPSTKVKLNPPTIASIRVKLYDVNKPTFYCRCSAEP